MRTPWSRFLQIHWRHMVPSTLCRPTWPRLARDDAAACAVCMPVIHGYRAKFHSCKVPPGFVRWPSGASTGTSLHWRKRMTRKFMKESMRLEMRGTREGDAAILTGAGARCGVLCVEAAACLTRNRCKHKEVARWQRSCSVWQRTLHRIYNSIAWAWLGSAHN